MDLADKCPLQTLEHNLSMIQFTNLKFSKLASVMSGVVKKGNKNHANYCVLKNQVAAKKCSKIIIKKESAPHSLKTTTEIELETGAELRVLFKRF